MLCIVCSLYYVNNLHENNNNNNTSLVDVLCNEYTALVAILEANCRNRISIPIN